MAQLGKAAADIGINVVDIAGQKKFYGDLLGLPYLGELQLPHAEVHFFACGNSLLKLYWMSDLERPIQTQKRHAGLAYFTINVRDLSRAVEELVRAGATILEPITEFDALITLPDPIGRVRARYAMVADADGNQLELMEKD